MQQSTDPFQQPPQWPQTPNPYSQYPQFQQQPQQQSNYTQSQSQYPQQQELQHSEPLPPQQQQWHQPDYTQPPTYNPPQQPPTKSRAMDRILWILIGVAIGLVFGLVLGSSYEKLTTTPSSTTTTQDTTQATSQPTQAAVTPTHTNTPKWSTVQTFTGNGAKNTAIFTAPNDWKIVWNCDNTQDQYNIDGLIYISVYNADGSDFDPNAVSGTCKAGKITADFTEEHRSGKVYLAVNTGLPWTIQVQELK